MMCVDSCVGGFFFQAEDGIRDLVRSRGLGDVYKRQIMWSPIINIPITYNSAFGLMPIFFVVINKF